MHWVTVTCSGRQPANRRGASLVEFALVAPLFFMLVFGIAGFAHAYLVQHALAAAARDAARLAVVTCDLKADDVRVNQRAQDILADAKVTGAVVTNNKPAKLGDEVRVEVSLDYTPIIGNAVSFVGLPTTLKLKERSIMRFECQPR